MTFKTLFLRHIQLPVLAAVLSTGAIFAHGDKEPGEKAADQHQAPAQAPASDLEKTWAMIHEQHEALEHAIENKELAKVHEFAFAIRDLLKKMPALSSALSAEDRKKLDGAVERSAGIADALDESGDAGNQKATEEQEGRLDKLLHYIANLYPKGLLGAEGDHGEHGDPDHKHE